jgi:hypothetical protein
VQAGRLVRLLPGYLGRRADIWAVYPSRRHLSVKVRLFVDHVAPFFQPPTGAPAAPRQRAAKQCPASTGRKRAG